MAQSEILRQWIFFKAQNINIPEEELFSLYKSQIFEGCLVTHFRPNSKPRLGYLDLFIPLWAFKYLEMGRKAQNWLKRRRISFGVPEWALKKKKKKIKKKRRENLYGSSKNRYFKILTVHSILLGNTTETHFEENGSSSFPENPK